MVGAVGIGYVMGARFGPALHPMVCEYKIIKLIKKKDECFSSCDEPFWGHSGALDVRNTKSIGFRECYVVDEEHQP